MYTLFAYLARFFSASQQEASASDFPHQLMDSAQARAGHDQQQARELRAAAAAYLRVVR